MPDMLEADPLTGTAMHLLPGGEAVVHTHSAKQHHKTCLVRQAIPGDKLLLSAMVQRRGVLKAAIEKIEIPSKQRVLAACDVADRCGGCALQYLHADAHAQVKSDWVYHAFKPVIYDKTQWIPIENSNMSTELGQQRRRVRWHIARNTQKQVILGFRVYQSHDVVEVGHCMVVTSALEAVRQALQVYLTACDKALPESVYAVQLTDGMHIVLEYEKTCPKNMRALPQQDGFNTQYWYRDKQGLRAFSKPICTLHDALPTSEKDILIHIGPDDFVQGQASGNRMMIQQVQAWCKGSTHIVDLFSGAGNLSLPLAASGMQVVGAEVHEGSVRAANANAKRLALQARYQQADLFGNFNVSDFVGADVLMVDPPRKGAKKICSLMNHLLPKKVILIHCDATSAGRDALEMQRQGYGLQALRALDLFPYSGHVESMSLWAR